MRKIRIISGQKYKFKHLRWYWAYLIAGVLTLWALVSVYQNNSLISALSNPVIDFEDEKTSQYIADFDPLRYEYLGSDYDNPLFLPYTRGIPRDQIDNVYDYDFERLAKVEVALKGVDRSRALKHIFETVTEGTTTDTERHLAVLRFLHKSGYHNGVWQPMYPDKSMVTDPLVLLEVHEMRCGHIARVAVDLFESVGYRARVVQLGGHIIAEIFYEGDWHYFDADAFGGGETVLDAKGEIPSLAELSRADHRYQLDSLAAWNESIFSPLTKGWQYISYFYFSKNAYANVSPSYSKKDPPRKEANNLYYGWDHRNTTIAGDIELFEAPVYYMPSAVSFTAIQVDQKQNLAFIEWSASEDIDNDLLGYRVFISNSSRGWDFLQFAGEKDLRSFWSGASSDGWDPGMYDSLFELPPHEVALIKTEKTSIDFPMKKGVTYYVTVMPYDAHGESVGKKLYFMSNEIKVFLDQ